MNRVSEILNIKYPIIQAPMSWLTSAGLVAMNAKGADLDEVTAKLLSRKTEQSGLISGQADNEYINAGLAISFAKEIKTAKALIDELMADFQ